MSVRIENHAEPGAGPLPTLPARSDPAVRRIAREWRRLTNPRAARTLPDASRRTLVGVSGGADSTALLLALAGVAREHIGIAHVLHDLRPSPHPQADRDAVAALAARLGIPFHERSITIDRSRNLEAGARAARYAALAEMARHADCPFLATAHHADDQLESIVMALLRGAGPDGLRAIAPRRPLSGATPPGDTPLPSRDRPQRSTVTLIRPCLQLTRAEAEALCRRCHTPWRDDHTNRDTTRLRAALRHGPLADLALLRPDAARHASRSALLLRDAAGLVRDRARDVFADATTWPRDALRAEREIVLGAGLRAAALRLTRGRGADRLTGALLDPAIRAIRDNSTNPRTFHWPDGLTLEITTHHVALTR